MRVGVDYYPEQWESSMWQSDAEKMAQSGVKLVRLSDFAWSKLEPREGEFTFGWLDHVIDIFSRYGIGIILSIPTNCPPLWMYQSYPEIIQIRPDGKRLQIGNRGHRCVNSPVFVKYARRIACEMVKRYGKKKSVIVWQIDSELEAYPCCCDVCKEKFRKWLIEKYNDLDSINAAYGTSVWSGDYSDISQIEPPTAYPKACQNPSLCLDWYRFTSQSAAGFVKEIAELVRLENPKVILTTNTVFSNNTPDLYHLFEELDFVSYDNYPPISLEAEEETISSHAFELDMMRGVKGADFWVMEQLSGPTGSYAYMSPAPKPGQIMGYAMQAFAHGADAVLHFRWRTAATGAEMFRHGLLDHSNVPNRRFYEFSELCKSAVKLTPLLSTRLIADIAIVYSPEIDHAFKIQPQVRTFDYMEQLKMFHSAFSHFGANVDVVSGETDLSEYKLVIAPSMYVNNSAVTENLYRYVINGGTLVLTARSGVKDANNNCIIDTLPTVYKELAGIEITEYDPIGEQKHVIRDFAGNEFSCHAWCDVIQATSAKAYAEYTDGWYRCLPAVTMNRYCNGIAYYIGTVCGLDFYESFASNLMMQTGIPRLKDLPRGVEVTTRTNGKDEYIFFFNNSEKDVSIPLPKPMYSVIYSIVEDELQLKPFEMDVVRK